MFCRVFNSAFRLVIDSPKLQTLSGLTPHLVHRFGVGFYKPTLSGTVDRSFHVCYSQLQDSSAQSIGVACGGAVINAARETYRKAELGDGSKGLGCLGLAEIWDWIWSDP